MFTTVQQLIDTTNDLIDFRLMNAMAEISEKMLAALALLEDVPGVIDHQVRLSDQLRELEWRCGWND